MVLEYHISSLPATGSMTRDLAQGLTRRSATMREMTPTQSGSGAFRPWRKQASVSARNTFPFTSPGFPLTRQLPWLLRATVKCNALARNNSAEPSRHGLSLSGQLTGRQSAMHLMSTQMRLPWISGSDCLTERGNCGTMPLMFDQISNRILLQPPFCQVSTACLVSSTGNRTPAAKGCTRRFADHDTTNPPHSEGGAGRDPAR